MPRASRALIAAALQLVACAEDGASAGPTSSDSTVTGAGGAGAGSSGTGGVPATGGGASAATGGGAPYCARCESPTDLGSPLNTAIVESSGLAASALHAGAYYVHNDSGDGARFYAMSERGADLGTYDVTGASAVDWEDMARGPCPTAGSCLYFGDIGDNPRERSSYAVYRVPEPSALVTGTHSVRGEAFVFEYPDGSHNAEALLVHPQTGGVYVVTKDGGGTQVYGFPLPLDSSRTVTLSLLGTVDVPDLLPLVTAGDIRPQGDALLLRTYSSVWLYAIGPGATLESALAAAPCALPSPFERQAEAIAWAHDGESFRTISEGAGQTLHAVSCSR